MSTASTNPQQKFEKAGDNLDDTEVLRTFVEQLRRVIDVRPNMRNHIGEMERGNVKYYLYDISEVLKIMEEALKPVFRIDKQERKKRKKREAAVKDEDAPDSPKGMSSGSDDAEEQWDGVGN
jgi:hypothetical protein